MLIINGVEVVVGPFIKDPRVQLDTLTYTDNHTVTLDQSGKTLVMNSNSNKAFTLPSVAAADVGTEFTFSNINTGRLTIDAADSDIIDDSNAGGTIYSDDNSMPSITLRLVSATKWHIVAANGVWTTT